MGIARLVSAADWAISKTMTAIEQDLLAALGELERAAKTMPTANPKPDLPRMFARIDALAARLPDDSDPGLRHYLQRKSYEKARLWLEGRDAENQAGHCGH
jgi:hypothetical protein